MSYMQYRGVKRWTQAEMRVAESWMNGVNLQPHFSYIRRCLAMMSAESQTAAMLSMCLKGMSEEGHNVHGSKLPCLSCPSSCCLVQHVPGYGKGASFL